jgi:exopolysaccharide production protein ExoY
MSVLTSEEHTDPCVNKESQQADFSRANLEEASDYEWESIMTNGTSAQVTSRRERPASVQTWRTTTTLTSGSFSRTSERSVPRELPTTAGNDVQSLAPTTVVGGAIKRGFDVIGASGALLLLLPLFAMIALIIRLWDRGPVFYRHRRIGLNGEMFDCLKFRSMVVNADEVLSRHLAANGEAAREWQETQKLKYDPRVTPLGSGLRKTSIDELPQLVNILKGEMSFVGPRPIVTAEVPKYGACMDHYLRARPGLTGPWQVSGRNDVDYATRVELDRDYTESWSFWRDLAIIAKTARVVVTARGCY